MKKQIYTLMILAALASCSNKEKEVERVSIPNLSESNSNLVIAPIVSSVEEENISSCDRLNELAVEAASNKDSEKFAYFSQLKYARGDWTAYLNISESPLLQYIIGEKFKLDSEEEFFEKVKAEYEAGRIGEVKWMYVKMMKAMGNLRSVQYSVTNEKLEEKFPGIFGKIGSANNSLHLGMASRIGNVSTEASEDLAKILSTKISLFSGSDNWNDYAVNVKKSLSAASKGLNSADNKERICSLVLFHQNFAQLLRLKGFHAPVSKKSREAHGRGMVEKLNGIPEFSDKNQEVAKYERYGAFLDMKSRETTILESEDISKYDPSKGLLALASSPVFGEDTHDTADLSQTLAFMDAMVATYEATSPASPWISEYFLGDIQESNKAILPSDGNTLALGLLTINFKNLAGLHIKKINSAGKLLRDGETAAGVVIASSAKSEMKVTMKVSEVARLSMLVAYLENALKNFLKRDPVEIITSNPGYKFETLIALFGKNLIQEREINMIVDKMIADNKIPADHIDAARREYRAAILNAIEQPSLIDNLRTLRLPLALVLSKMGTAEKGCVSEVNWNLATGAVVPTAVCSANDKALISKALMLLGRSTKAPILLKKAGQIK